jgi:NAD(P)-dependent dehydrogenase (short-subunit alcohol dehydrogenase family)
MAQTAVIVGVGRGLSASLARLFSKEGFNVVLAARNTSKLSDLISATGAMAVACDAVAPEQVDALFQAVEKKWSVPDLVVFNAGFRVRGPLQDLEAEKVRETILASAYGGFLVAQAAAKRMLTRGTGSLFFTGASASVKGYPNSSPFAMGKFALRGLAQSLARELQPKGIHVAHFVIDGAIRQGDDDPRAAERGDDGVLLPDEIAKTYLHVHRQHCSAWSTEVELRPWVEKF